VNIEHLKILRQSATASPWTLDANSVGDAFGLRSAVHGRPRIGTHIDWAYLLALNEAAPELFAMVDRVAELEEQGASSLEMMGALAMQRDRYRESLENAIESINAICAEHGYNISFDLETYLPKG